MFSKLKIQNLELKEEALWVSIIGLAWEEVSLQ